MADLARLVLSVDSTGAVTGKIALENLAGAATKAQAGGKGIMDTFRNMQAVMQGPIAALNQAKAMFVQTWMAMDSMVMKAYESQEAQAILGSTLIATGANAWTSAAELNQYATEMSNLTLYSDEAIGSMQGVLLGFKNIKGVNFKEASTQILNMAQVMKMDLTSAAQAVGKALDDPIAGINSLTRQGFRFSESQKEMLKTMVETGNIANAQKIIMDELATTYGGAAESAARTATGEWLQMKKAIADVQEAYGDLIAEFARPVVISVKKELQSLASIISGRTALQSVLDSLKRDARGNIYTTKEVSTDDLASAIAFAESEIKRLRTEHPVLITPGWKKQNEENISNLRIAIDLMEPYLVRLGAIEKAENAAAAAKKKASDEADKAAAALAKEREELEKLGKLPKTYWDGVKPRENDYSPDTEWENRVNAINDVIEAERKAAEMAKILAEAEANLVANSKSGEEAFAALAAIIKQEKIDLILGDLKRSMDELITSGVGDAYLDIMAKLGYAMAGSGDVGQGLADVLLSLGETILTQLPRLLLTAGLKLIIEGNYGLGLTLLGLSGIVALGGGMASHYSEQAQSNASTESASTAAATATASRRSTSTATVNLMNASGTPLAATATETNDGMGGRTISIELTRAIRGAVASGALDSSMRSRFGLASIGVRKE